MRLVFVLSTLAVASADQGPWKPIHHRPTMEHLRGGNLEDDFFNPFAEVSETPMDKVRQVVEGIKAQWNGESTVKTLVYGWMLWAATKRRGHQATQQSTQGWVSGGQQQVESDVVPEGYAAYIAPPVSKKMTIFGDSTKSSAVLLGWMLAFNSGFINGCALSGALGDGAKQAVAAVTASWTNSALSLADGNVANFGFLAKVILAFMGGSTLAGLMNPKPTQFEVSKKQLMGPFLVGALLVCLAVAPSKSADSVAWAWYLCAAANGLQNSVTSTLTGNLCRTSHFSGITSDMGTFLGQVLAGNKENLYKLKVFAGLAASFWAGGYASFEFSKELSSNSLFVSAAIFLLAGAFNEYTCQSTSRAPSA